MPQPSPVPISLPQVPNPSQAETPPGGSSEANDLAVGAGPDASAAEAAAAAQERRAQQIQFAILAALVGAVIWAYQNTLFGKRGITIAWDNPQYSFGWLIPLFAVALLFLRRQPIGKVSPAERWAGVGLIGASAILRVAATWANFNTIDMGSMVPMLLGVFLMVGGWKTLRWAGPPIVFLLFMYPLPMSVERKVLMPLKTVATVSSTYVLQTMGMDAYNEGNVIKLREQTLEVADACSGLRMLTILFALAVAMALVIAGPWWEQSILIASAVPIAVLVNIIRIVVTGILYITAGPDVGKETYHMLAGLFMIPLATGFLYVESMFLSHLWIEDDAQPVDLPVPHASGRGLPI